MTTYKREGEALMSHSNQGESFKCRTASVVRVEVYHTSRSGKEIQNSDN